MSGTVGPPSPVASIRITAAINGEPKMSATAAKLPAAAITMSICGGASRRTRLARKRASPPPSAMRGASGPITAPRPIEARAARTTPGRSIGRVRPALRPSAGTWPPFPGSRTMAKAVISPAMASTGRDHQTGVLSKPSVPGRSSYTPTWIQWTASRNPQAT